MLYIDPRGVREGIALIFFLKSVFEKHPNNHWQLLTVIITLTVTIMIIPGDWAAPFNDQTSAGERRRRQSGKFPPLGLGSLTLGSTEVFIIIIQLLIVNSKPFGFQWQSWNCGGCFISGGCQECERHVGKVMLKKSTWIHSHQHDFPHQHVFVIVMFVQVPRPACGGACQGESGSKAIGFT